MHPITVHLNTPAPAALKHTCVVARTRGCLSHRHSTSARYAPFLRCSCVPTSTARCPPFTRNAAHCNPYSSAYQEHPAAVRHHPAAGTKMVRTCVWAHCVLSRKSADRDADLRGLRIRSVLYGHHSNHQTSSILQIGTFWVLRRSRSCRHLPPFRSTIFRCAPCSYTSLQSKVSKPSLTAYQEQQHALTGRACLLRAGVCTLHCAAATLPLRYRCAITSLQLRCRSVAGSAIRTPQPAPACSAPTSCRSQASSVPPEPTVPQMTN